MNARDDFGRTPLHFAVSKGHPAVMKLLIDRGADVNAKEHVHGHTALMIAAQEGTDSAVQILIDRVSSLIM